ncbi:MAG: hypothetical protein US83_C0001G0088 [Candidatus Falkowbacteria bacterium GW2011_GWC2_38_22]|uniref:IrrE N-terminal-like domain-containing protein n=1 Tax=Candidatus Falkowbacteria bacterium GW2011_GWE1_38_31 TaxID=1618638 RepID=A0A0G0MB69_9BACT|nr:MAG: hypothetical protein US73_C0004G0040 [Candidatus Falkowbacteria bacterium GW2011_GWF2_38_1205]KKQ62154.1 MAG: hypothetical protein US83_C0001G0088 [Candidatus Falkowbacteria bacterium GW2011_GWC2_38_22]KKQ64304.1 MAG: hypothetical protein US84_C0001G0088 [Candidatus Falkowbacteria bacterium GW2011_GWF1_38_22]KKQ66281.1 MAG: hypothetical protein US87_C0002G0088 [Candidatus Falkowbacteria bacterium GW2011_GWE2_38_254]KKQ71009.1 MAG: hypothetical protein US91_C0002G0088 [Candidatus Falkowb
MDFSKFRTPYIKKDVIKIKADTFRKMYWNDSIPVDIEKIIDVKLGIDIIPTPDMMKLCNTDALISSDFTSINVDNDWYNDERNMNRLRFSLAHEMGHFVLHKDIYGSFKIESLDDFYNFIENISQQTYRSMEWQAQTFASYLLVPRDMVRSVYKKIYDEVRQSASMDFSNIEEEFLNDLMSVPMSKEFGISAEAMFYVLSEYKN